MTDDKTTLLLRCSNCDTLVDTWHTITVGAVEFHLCERCDDDTTRNGAALASFYRRKLDAAYTVLRDLRRPIACSIFGMPQEEVDRLIVLINRTLKDAPAG